MHSTVNICKPFLKTPVKMQLIFIFVGGLLLNYAKAKTGSEYFDLMTLIDNDEFQWGAEENMAMQAHTNGSEYEAHHQLTKRQAVDSEQPLLQNKDFGPCRTPLGDSGRCRHIIYCRMPDLQNDVWRLVSQLCIIEKSSIGICCTDSQTSNRISPQFGDGNEKIDEGRTVNHPEQRGCGITTRQFPAVTSGRPAEPDEWPWMAAILRQNVPYVWCGGALITDRHVLTAAHCLHQIKQTEMFVRLGEYNTHQVNETRARDFRIAKMVLHVDYDSSTYRHDIALIRIEGKALFNTYIWNVCMPPINGNWESRDGIVMGWGSTKFGGPRSSLLTEVALPIWNQAACDHTMVESLPDTMFCAGHPDGGIDSCQGDSGGPLLLQLPNRRWITVGIVSWGVRCGEANRPGVYTRVDKYIDWVHANADI